MKSDAAAKTEKVINQVADTVQQGNYQEAWNNFWATYSDSIMNFCKILVLALIIILIAMFVGRLTRKIIMRAVDKVPSLDHSVGNIFYSIRSRHSHRLCRDGAKAA